MESVPKCGFSFDRKEAISSALLIRKFTISVCKTWKIVNCPVLRLSENCVPNESGSNRRIFLCYIVGITIWKANNLWNMFRISFMQSYKYFYKKVEGVCSLNVHTFQVMCKEDTTRKTYVYELAIPIAPRWVSLVAGPLEVLPDQTNLLISNLCLPYDLSRLRNTMEFFHEAYRSVNLYSGNFL